MVLRYQNYHYLRGAITLWGLTALFVLVRCSVPERDYSLLNIGDGPGGGGEAGSGGDGSGGSTGGSAGAGGQGGWPGEEEDAGSLGGQGGAPPVPIPCNTESSDAGSEDAGITDAGAEDASTGEDAGSDPCACVEGFIQAVDVDGDGVGTRACSLAPGLDCDDNDGAVTHNSCGGCAVLSNTLGEDCSECGAYVCDGPDAVACASKPGPVEDPDCRCQNALIVARDTDGDGQGTRLCEYNPGIDCNDGDNAFVTNQCGGCAELPGAVGGGCNECGVWQCNGTALVCVPTTVNNGRQCLNTTIRQTCINDGFWGSNFSCPDACYQGNCETCIPGTYLCGFYTTGDAVYICDTDASLGSSSYGIGWASFRSCSGTTPRCNPTNGSCTSGQLLLPRDRTFDVAPALPGGLPWHEILNTANEADYG